MTELQPGDIVRRVRGDSAEYPFNTVTEIVGTGKLAYFEACFELVYRPQQWHPFDINDESTWPLEGKYWVTRDDGKVRQEAFRGTSLYYKHMWQDVTHWMEIVPPASPNAQKENN